MSPPPTQRYKNHRFPAEVLSRGVWLYYRFCLSCREAEELLFVRGVIVSYEATRQWWRTFGQPPADPPRRRRPRPGATWHLGAGLLTLRGKRHDRWRAADQEGNALDLLVQRRRDPHAAAKFFRRLLKGLASAPRVLITAKLTSYGAAKRGLLAGAEHRQHRHLDTRAGNAHRPRRPRERRMQGFKSPGHAQCFRPRRPRLPAPAYRQERRRRFHPGRAPTSVPAAA